MRYAIGVRVIKNDKEFDAIFFCNKTYDVIYLKNPGHIKENDSEKMYLIVFDSAKEATTYSQFLRHNVKKNYKMLNGKYLFYPVRLDTKEFPFIAKERVLSEKIRYGRFAELNVDPEKSLGYYHYHEWKQK